MLMSFWMSKFLPWVEHSCWKPFPIAKISNVLALKRTWATQNVQKRSANIQHVTQQARLIRNAMSPPRQAYTACFFLFVFFLYRLRFSGLFQFLCIFASPYFALTPMSASHSSPPSLFSLLAFKLNAFSIECLLSLALHLLTNPAFRMLPSGQTDSRV